MSRQLDPFAINFCEKQHHDTYPFINPASTPKTHVGKSVFITGASKGVGRATAISFAKAGASAIGIGARSDLSSLQTEIAEAAKSAGHPPPKVISVKLDVTAEKSVEDAKMAVSKALDGKLDILINNAGYLEQFRRISESDPSEYWKSWGINLKGVYLCTRAFIPLLLAGNDRTIINLSSIGALRVSPGASAYQTAKMALLRFSEFTCAEYADQGLLAYSIHPGGVMTELASVMPKEMHGGLVDTAEMGSDTITWLTREKRDWLAARYLVTVKFSTPPTFPAPPFAAPAVGVATTVVARGITVTGEPAESVLATTVTVAVGPGTVTVTKPPVWQLQSDTFDVLRDPVFETDTFIELEALTEAGGYAVGAEIEMFTKFVGDVDGEGTETFSDSTRVPDGVDNVSDDD
ncbi:MAG: hypothetical protein Q9227_001989 [Pyrenula ochraceoflavens]